MNTDVIMKLLQDVSMFVRREKTARVSPQDLEYEALRENMRGQFMKLKEKGLSIRIVTL